jgi:hypothetical protein
MPARRFRFSLQTILFLVALAACGFTIWRLQREMGPVRVELASLRKEVGALEIRDHNKVHAIELPTRSKLQRKWRIWIPPGRQAMFCFAYQNLLRTGLPHSQGGSQAQSGEHIVEWRYEPNLQDGLWKQVVDFGENRGHFFGGPYAPPKWLETSFHQEGAGHETTVEGNGLPVFDNHDGGKRVLIQRIRYSGVSNEATKDLNGPLPGFVLWVELQ